MGLVFDKILGRTRQEADFDAISLYAGTWNIARITDNGVPSFYKATADTNSARGTALKLAISEASSGDKIYVRAGTYDCNDLLVDGVYYYFEDGAIIDYTGAVAGAILSDDGDDFEINIDGYGIFRNQNNGDGGVNFCEALNLRGETSGTIKCKELFSTKRACTISQTGGAILNIYCENTLSDLTGIDGTGSGILYYYGKSLITGSECIDFDGTSNEAELYFYIDRIEGSGTNVIVNTGTYLVEIHNSYIKSNSTSQLTGDVQTNEAYINCVFECNNADEFSESRKIYNCRNYDNTPITCTNGNLIYLGDNITRLTEKSADPSDPAEGNSVMWQSDGTGSGDDGDIMMKITVGATTKTITLVDFSES